MDQHEAHPGQAKEPDSFGAGVEAASDVYGDTAKCPNCGATVTLAGGEPGRCPDCGASVPHTAVTEDTDAPAPG